MTENSRQFGYHDDQNSQEMFEPFEKDEDDSMYAALRDELSKPAEVEPMWLPIPARPDMELKFDTAISFDDFRTLIKRHTKQKKFNALMFGYALISQQNTGFAYKGREMFDGNDPMTVASPELQGMMDVRGAAECIRKLYVTDGGVLQTVNKLSDAAGFGESDLESGDTPLGI
jgi:hypothetical protein